MERSADSERVRVLVRTRDDAQTSALVSSGMVAFLVALALLFIVTAPPT